LKLLTKQSDYAIRALIELARTQEDYLSSREISRKQNIPYQFLRRILGDLIKSGMVESREGAGGGMKLAGDPHGIKITEVLEIFQGGIELSDCMFRKKICENRKTCVLRKEIKRIEQVVIDEFSRITIGSLTDKIETED